MTATVLRKELHTYIDTMPDRSLPVLKPLLSFLADPPYTVETDLTDEENALIEKGMAEYRANPSSFKSWASIRKGSPASTKTTSPQRTQ